MSKNKLSHFLSFPQNSNLKLKTSLRLKLSVQFERLICYGLRILMKRLKQWWILVVMVGEVEVEVGMMVIVMRRWRKKDRVLLEWLNFTSDYAKTHSQDSFLLCPCIQHLMLANTIFSEKITINMTSFSFFPFMIFNEVLWE
ncbi:hypothetical protein NC653_027170 [Populus alba x Populus x berolinensis]|uniref:Uncharacterized protein n=1 Tax=Populus alba x Populus x berolinensis TaxID=444605 RepID=A0AAD6Q4Q8_9ROSI|nr:hypothetical protein NC653_027170 [Populus alba x Populus x berolinensis]